MVDENGRVYVIGYTGGGENHLFAYDANGTKAWDSNVSSPPFEIPSVVDSSLLLSDDGNLYFGCFDKKLYSLEIGVGPANSDWPMFEEPVEGIVIGRHLISQFLQLQEESSPLPTSTI